MSNEFAIAAVTETLRGFLQTTINNTASNVGSKQIGKWEVTARPPDVAAEGVTGTRLNFFLYQIDVNAAWRNMDIPYQVSPGGRGAPPLALNVRYMLTAYANNDEDTVSHWAIGAAMKALHDHPVFGEAELRKSLGKNSNIGTYVDSVRVTYVPTSVEDMSKLWTTFQSKYRMSVVYEATVVLIESLPRNFPLPVLMRGPGDRGVITDVGSALQVLDIQLPHSQRAAQLGDDIKLIGQGFRRENSSVRFTSARLATPVELRPKPGGNQSELIIGLPPSDSNAMSEWAAGFYSVGVVTRRTDDQPAYASNEVSFALAPAIEIIDPQPPKPPLLLRAAPGDAITVSCAPRIGSSQRVTILLGDKQTGPERLDTPSDEGRPSTVVFKVPKVAPGHYVVRLRVDGVDSIPVIYTGTPSVPAFDPRQTVEVLA